MNKAVDTPAEQASVAPKKREPVLMTIAVDPSLVPDFEALEKLTRQLPETDGVPLESPWHLAAISLAIQVLTYLWRDRDDFFVGGNMFLYYSTRHLRNEEFKGPDFFYVSGVERRRKREFWVVWEEQGNYPDLIIEFLSRSTAETDRTTKKALYEQVFRTPEYFCFDPETNCLEGWRLRDGAYQELVTDERGWIWSNVLQLWLGTWMGEFQGLQATWLRFYDAEGKLILHQGEAEHQRAEAAEAELARLKALLAQKGITPDNAT